MSTNPSEVCGLQSTSRARRGAPAPAPTTRAWRTGSLVPQPRGAAGPYHAERQHMGARGPGAPPSSGAQAAPTRKAGRDDAYRRGRERPRVPAGQHGEGRRRRSETTPLRRRRHFKAEGRHRRARLSGAPGASGIFCPCERRRAELGSHSKVNESRLIKTPFLWSAAPFSAAVRVRRRRQWQVKSDSSMEARSPRSGKGPRAGGAGHEGFFCSRLVARRNTSRVSLRVP